jgi:hypothetical protein
MIMSRGMGLARYAAHECQHGFSRKIGKKAGALNLDGRIKLKMILIEDHIHLAEDMGRRGPCEFQRS